jgi:hypothetical protein
LRFVWFWTFWHWSTEGFRSSALLRSPLQGIASHWNEWYENEASESERHEIEAIGHNGFEQRRFVCWLARHWAREAQWRDERLPARYVLAQLSHVSPFDNWTVFEKYRTTYASPGVAAIVLTEESAGEATDVRTVEAVALPLDEDSAAGPVVADGFQADSGDLNTARRAALSLLDGRGLAIFLGLWILTGVRPYPRFVRWVLVAGWIAVLALIVRLLAGSDPRNALVPTVATLFTLWSLLVVTALATVAVLATKAWSSGQELRKRMEERQVHLRMNGGLSVYGGSAGLAFCLNDLLATYRSHPLVGKRSWLWEKFFRNLRLASHRWAATGIVDSDGSVEHVVLEPKIRACLRNENITDVLTPWQPGASQRMVDRAAATTKPVRRAVSSEMAYGFAAGQRKLRSHRCRHAAQSIIAIGDFASRSQVATNVLALAVTVVMALALPDIHNVLDPAAPPRVVAPGSPSPYYLWISLDTRRPEAFTAELESNFWSNRRANVIAYGGADGSARAEMRLNRTGRAETLDERDGIIWIERRRKFLTREFQPGDRIASYPFAHMAGIRHE